MKLSPSVSLLLWSVAVLAQEKRTVAIPMRDGIHLATDLYGLSLGTRLPVLLLRTPYDKRAKRFTDLSRCLTSGW